jgi:Domain of unknown function (DUF6249)
MEGTIAVLIPFGFMGMIAAIVIMPRYFRSQERQKMAELMRAAIERGQPLPQDVIDAMSSNVRVEGGQRIPMPPSPSRDLRTGLIWLGVAVGLASMGLAISFEDPDALFPLLGCAAFPAFIGVAFVIMWAVARDKK